MNKHLRQDLGEFLDHEVYPALFDRLDRAFPEYGFQRRGNHWVASAEATRALPGSPRLDRVYCYSNRPWCLVIQGGNPVRFLDLVNGGTKPTGADFPEAVRKLSELARVPFPQREVSPEEAKRHAKRHARRSALEAVCFLCRATLLSEDGKAARAYLEGRGLDACAQETLGLGLYPSVLIVEAALRDGGHDVEAARAEALLFKAMEGYAVFPWADASGQPMTIYGRWPEKTPPQHKPKTLALPGEGSKASPLYFDRARRAGLKHVVLVEGLVDAALLQAKGEAGVIACMASQFSRSQLQTLGRHGVRAVTTCLDPDGAGKKGTVACIAQLYKIGINAFVAPVLPHGNDPDEYVLNHGLDAWRRHIRQAEHAFRYKARAIVEAHKGEAWTDSSLAACLDEAVAFDAVLKDAERLTDLALFFWPEILKATNVDYNAINARREMARQQAEIERERYALEELVRATNNKLRDGDFGGAKDLLFEGADSLRKEECRRIAEPIRSVADELNEHEERLAQWRGREFIGIPQRTLPTLDKLTLGFRGLILLGAAPGTGKTNLAIQFGLDAVVHNKDVAFLFVSLEMSRWDMLTRFRSRLAGLDWHTIVFGSGFGANAPTFTKEEFEHLEQAHSMLLDIGGRIRILDNKNFPVPTLKNVLDQVQDLKASSGASRVFIVVDYLQVWPVPERLMKMLRTDLEADKWRIGQMKELRDGGGSANTVLVISEARKPPNDAQAWGGDMASVMGAARGTYTPDMVLLLNPPSDEELGNPGANKGDAIEAGKKVRERDVEAGFARQRLSIVKGRDGVQRGRVDLRFHFRQSRFEEEGLVQAPLRHKKRRDHAA
jgi:DNA primase